MSEADAAPLRRIDLRYSATFSTSLSPSLKLAQLGAALVCPRLSLAAPLAADLASGERRKGLLELGERGPVVVALPRRSASSASRTRRS